MYSFFVRLDLVKNLLPFLKTLICRKCANIFFLFEFSGRCPETRSLFAKREAKTLVKACLDPLPESRDGSLWRGCGGGATTDFH